MKKILKLNEISPVINDVFTDGYEVSKTVTDPDGIILRSFDMHEYPMGENLLAIARAGAGTNNIPIDECTKRGIVVFNSPGANANAVKELAIAALLLGSRKIIPAIEWVDGIKNEENVAKLVEKGKSAFIGGEIYGKKLGVIGLGAVGALVANAAIHLGMDVLGYDPYISVEYAWSLSRNVKRITSLEQVIKESDYITIHVPLLPSTKYTFNEQTIAMMKDGAVLVNCSRGELVDNNAVINAVKSGKLSRYITDFPSAELIGVENIICIPHLGASTPEAEDNCAEMSAKELVNYLENGNILNSVNFPAAELPRSSENRITVVHMNKPNMISQITGAISGRGVNIANFIDKSRGDNAYSIIDVESAVGEDLLASLRAIDGVVKVRAL